jgi:phosphatidylglycerophosphatase A
MSEPTDAPGEAASVASPGGSAAARKPRFALFIATACGLGYIPKAPGTFGSLAGLVLPLLPVWVPLLIALPMQTVWHLFSRGEFMGGAVGVSLQSPVGQHFDGWLVFQCALTLATAAIGVWSASRAARFWKQKDPQRVVIDEVSGQHLTLLVGCGVPIWWRAAQTSTASFPLAFISDHTALSWKYLLLGFILFRVFDIWKPFPARQAESLPGGWGIMADDWVAGIYAAIGLWIARAAGL